MQFNTAVCLLALSASLLALNFHKKSLCLLLALLTGAVAVLTLAEYVFYIDLGIDQLFMRGYASLTTAHPGRMAPHTAIALLTTALSLGLSAKKQMREWTLLSAEILSLVTIALASTTLYNLLLPIEASEWHQYSLMAPETAISFIVLNLGILIHFLEFKKEQQQKNFYYVKCTIGFVGLLTTFSLYIALLDSEDRQIRHLTHQRLESFKSELNTLLSTRIQAFERIAHRWEFNNGTNYAEWANDAHWYLKHQPDYEAIAWIDPRHRVRWVEPLNGNKKFIGFNLDSDPERHKALTAAKKQHQLQLTPTLTLKNGVKGFIAFTPLYNRDGKFDGYMAGSFNVQKLLSTFLKHTTTQYQVSLKQNNALVFANSPSQRKASDAALQYSAADTFDFNGIHWQISAALNKDELARLHTPLPGLSLLLGSILTVFLIILLYFVKTFKSQQRLLEDSVRKFEAIFNQTYQFIGLLTPEGTILKANQSALTAAGIKEEDVIGKPFWETPWWSYATEAQNQLKDAIARANRGEFVRFEAHHPAHTGEMLTVDFSLKPLTDENGKVVMLIPEGRDITDRKKMETALERAKDTAEETSKFKSEFLANMSHEIRTPMNGILGMTEIALGTDLEQQQRRYLEMVHSSGKALLTIINDILDFSKIEAGKLTLDPIPFKLHDQISETLLLFDKAVQDKGLELRYQIETDVPEIIIADPTRIRQIVTNLVSNAIKFTLEGEIVLGLEVYNKEGNEITLHGWVKDTGIGLAPEKLNSIFEPFSQADNSITRNYGGTGLGLSITTQLLSMMNGELWLESELGQGSTFHFTLAATFPEEIHNQTVNPVDFSILKNLPVLVVDDNQTSLRILSELLKRWGMRTTLSHSGPEALEKLEFGLAHNLPYPLLISDFQMPDMNGFELAEIIRQDVRCQDTKIIILSSFAQAGDASKCRDIQIDGYLPKPIKQADLLYMIRTVLADSELTEHTSKVITKHSLRESRRKLRILLAEDNHINQVVAITVLEQAGHQVVTVANGHQALEAWRHDEFDMILMDMHMPEMDGIEATQKIRQEEEKEEVNEPISIIALTANAIASDREKCLAAGMNSYIAKPFDRDELLATIDSLAPSQSVLTKAESEPDPIS